MSANVKLVFSTAEIPNFENQEFFDNPLGQEARYEARDTIKLLNKSRRRRCGMSGKQGSVVRTKEERRIIFTKIIEAISSEGKSLNDLYYKVYGTSSKDQNRVKKLNNDLQIIRKATQLIVSSKNGKWQIDRGYKPQSGKTITQELVETVMSNLNVMWKKKDHPSLTLGKAIKKADHNTGEIIKKADHNTGEMVFFKDSPQKQPVNIPICISVILRVKIEIEK